MTNRNLPDTTKQPRLPTPHKMETVEINDPRGICPETEAAAERLVAAMTDLRESNLDMAAISSLLAQKVREAETSAGESNSVTVGESLGEIVKENDVDVDIEVPEISIDDSTGR